MINTGNKNHSDNEVFRITDINAYINQVPKELENAEVKHCPRCNENRFTNLEKCSFCGCSYESLAYVPSFYMFDPQSLFKVYMSYLMEKRRKLSLKKTIKGKYISIGESVFGITKPGDTVVFNRVYCIFQTKKDIYAITKDRYGYNLLIQPYPSGEVSSFTLESRSNGDIVAINGDKTIILRPIE